jgi:hypothetical protein
MVGRRTKELSPVINTHDYKMTVMLKPHLWVNHNFYTGDLDFSTDVEWKKWEADYEKYILDFCTTSPNET